MFLFQLDIVNGRGQNALLIVRCTSITDFNPVEYNITLYENEIAKKLFVPVYSKSKRGPCTWLKNYVIILLFVVNVRYKVHSINADVLI